VEYSAIYADFHRRRHIPAIFVPWGTWPGSCADLGLQRDIDVLWMGTRRTRRRSNAIDTIRAQLSTHGVDMHVVDGVENPFVFGQGRTQLLNRSKLTISVLPHPYDRVFPHRFHIAAGNRCLVVSEPELPHYAGIYEPDNHYVSAPVESMAQTILHYLEREQERLRIVENAYQLVTNKLAFSNSIRAIMAAISECGRGHSTGTRLKTSGWQAGSGGSRLPGQGSRQLASADDPGDGGEVGGEPAPVNRPSSTSAASLAETGQPIVGLQQLERR
jgi:hypothetical protein